MKRPTLQLDLKDMNIDQSTANNPHILLGSIFAVLLIIVFLAFNAPSASVSKESNGDPKGVDAQAIHEINMVANPIQSNLVSNDSIGFDKNAAEIVEETTPKVSTIKVATISEYTDQSNPIDAITEESITQMESQEYLSDQPWQETKVKKGDTLSQLFDRLELATLEAYKIADLAEAAPLLKIKPGETLKIKKTPNGKLGILQYTMSTFETLNVISKEGQYQIETTIREPEVRINNARAIIYSSLLSAASKADVSLNTMYNFIAMFGWKIDFSMDIRVGDQFSLIYEELYLDDKKVGDGDIIAAELVVSNKTYQAIRHIDEEGFTAYFAPNGDGIKGTFLRSPLKFGHITSNFSKNRLHPIKKVWRAHKGVDYGAPKGTPIMATGDGVVKIARREGGYGKTIILRHGGKYETLYAHLSGYAKGIKSGVRVKQGDVIGYVGSTGLATGPHLHYEFRIHGVHKNPVTVEFPKSNPIDPKYLSQFEKIANIWVGELEQINRIPLAQGLNQ